MVQDSYGGRAPICAAPEKVWTVITDSVGYAEWDSGIAGVNGVIGDIVRGQRLRMWKLIRKHNPGAAQSADRYIDGLRARAEKLS